MLSEWEGPAQGPPTSPFEKPPPLTRDVRAGMNIGGSLVAYGRKESQSESSPASVVGARSLPSAKHGEVLLSGSRAVALDFSPILLSAHCC
jgi:hypothetical protein